MSSVVFRVNASSSVGLGHVVRCRALAEELTARGVSCTMVGPSLDHSIDGDRDLFDSWHPILDWDSEVSDAHRLLDVLDGCNADRLVLDDYRVRVPYQRELARAGAPPWLQTAPKEGEAILGRWIYNANPSAREDVYRATAVDPSVELLVGPSYALLRHEFRSMDHGRLSDPMNLQVLVAFGGGDDRGATQLAIDALEPILDRAHVLVLSGRGNPRNADIEEAIDRSPSDAISLRIGPQNVAELFASSHVGLMSAGTATFEAAACGLPMVLIPVSGNQEGQARAWQDLGVATALPSLESVSTTQIRSAVHSLLTDPQERSRRGVRGRRLVDGRGPERVADALGGPRVAATPVS